MGFNAAEIYKSDSTYLRAEMIGNKMPTMVVADVELKDFGNGDMKLMLHFQGTDKTLPLNKTNAGTMQALYGDETDRWVNQRVMLFTMPVDFNGKKTLAIRLRAPQEFVSGTPNPTQQASGDPRGDVPLPESSNDYGANPLDDEIPF